MPVNVTAVPVVDAVGVFSVDEGGALEIDRTILEVSDADTTEQLVVFDVVAATGGFIDIDADGEADNTFTLAQLNEDTTVVFQHSGAEPSTGASLQLNVSDETATVEIPTIAIAVTGVIDESPVISGVDFLPVAENMVAAVVGTVQASDLDEGDALSYDVNDERFVFDDNRLRLADNTALDFEQSSSVDIVVTVTDTGNLSDTLAVSVAVSNLDDEAPVALSQAASGKHNTVIETLSNGETSLLSGSTDPDQGDDPSLRYAVLDQGPDDPNDGTVEVFRDGTFTFTPGNDRVDLEYTTSFTYRVGDGAGNESDPAQVSITVLALQAPVSDGTLEDLEATELESFVTQIRESLFTSPEGAELSWSVKQEGGGDLPVWLEFDADLRQLSGIPQDGDTGPLNLEVFVTDANGLRSDTLLFNLQVNDINQSPVIDGVTFNPVLENDPAAIVGTVQASDLDQSDTLSYSVNDDRFVFDDNQLRLGDNTALDFEQDNPVELAVTVTDNGEGNRSSTLAVEITVADVNEAPTAIAHIASGKHTTVITSLSNGETSLLSGATDPDQNDDPNLWTASLVQGPDGPNEGTAVVNPDGTFTFTPNDDEVDVEYTTSFTYQLSDGDGVLSDPAEVSITVLALQAPVSDGDMENLEATELDSFVTQIRESLFTSPEGAELTWSVRQEGGGDLPVWLEFDAVSRQLSGTPQDGDTGPLNLEVFVTDANGLRSDTLLFSVQVNDINLSPVIDSVSFNPVLENDPAAIVGTVQASDPDQSDTLSYSVNDDRFVFDGNQLRLADNTALDFEQDNPVELAVTVTDNGEGNRSSTLAVEITVADVNEAPTAIAHAASGKHTTVIDTLSNGETSLLSGATDPDQNDDPNVRIASLVQGPADANAGTVVVNPDGTFTFTPNDDDVDAGYTTSFTYQIADGDGALSDPAEVSITVLALQAPDSDGTLEDLEATELEGFLTQIRESLFTSPEGEELTWSVRQEGGGDLPAWLEFEAESRQLSGTPQDSDTGLLDLEVFVTDANGLRSDTLLFSVQVNDINQSPVIDSVSSMLENAPAALVGTVQASDPDQSDTLSYSVNDDRFVFDGNQLRLADSTALDFEQDNPVELAVTVTDNGEGNRSSTLAVEITVADVNEAPTAIAHAASGKHATVITTLSNGETSLLSGATDPDQNDDPNLRTASLVQGPADANAGTVIVNPDGTFTFTPNDDNVDVGYTTSFTYQIADGDGALSDPAEVSITVLALQAPVSDGTLEDLEATELDVFLTQIRESLFTSPEGAELTWSVRQEGGDDLPAWLEFDAVSRQLSGTPQDSDTGPLNLEVFVTDANGLRSDTLLFSVQVNDINQSPVIDGVSFNPVLENDPAAIVGTVQASDPDQSDTLSYSVNDDRFVFDGNQLRLADNTALDFEQDNPVELSVTVTDNGDGDGGDGDGDGDGDGFE